VDALNRILAKRETRCPLPVLEQQYQTAGEHVGDLLCWTLDDARITRDRLAAIRADVGPVR
jgi:hypothetical protein